MEKIEALTTLSALSHDVRLDVVRLLIQAGPDGRIAGDIAHDLGIRANTLSNNLSILLAAGLVRAERQGRAIRYFAAMEQMRALLAFLMEDCCGGRSDMCAPVLDTLTCGV